MYCLQEWIILLVCRSLQQFNTQLESSLDLRSIWSLFIYVYVHRHPLCSKDAFIIYHLVSHSSIQTCNRLNNSRINYQIGQEKEWLQMPRGPPTDVCHGQTLPGPQDYWWKIYPAGREPHTTGGIAAGSLITIVRSVHHIVIWNGIRILSSSVGHRVDNLLGG